LLILIGVCYTLRPKSPILLDAS